MKLNKKSMVLIGGGWKQFSGEEVDREEFFALIKETLGIDRERAEATDPVGLTREETLEMHNRMADILLEAEFLAIPQTSAPSSL